MPNDIHNTFRSLRREPLLAATILATLGLGIGMNAAIFSVLEAVVIRPLRIPNSDRVVAVWQRDRKDGSGFVVSAANFLDWQRQVQIFQALGAVQQYQNRDFNLSSGDVPDNVKGVRISPGCFEVLRVYPAIGRAFTPDDAQSGSQPVAILAHSLWVSRFGSDPNVAGRELRLNSTVVKIVGVMPASFEIPLARAQIYLPLQWTEAERQERRIAHYFVLGRLRDGISRQTAEAQLDSVARALEQQYPESNKDVGILISPLQEEVVGTVRPVLTAVFLGSACVLLLACVNLANLFSARGVKRQREIAIRASLGASQLRLLRQLLTEGLVVAMLGGVIGLSWGTLAVKFFVRLFNDTVYFSLPRREEIGLDWRVFVFTATACVLSGILFSIAPAWRSMKTDLVSSTGRTVARQHGQLRAVTLTAEVAFCFALVVASGLLVRSYERLRSEEPGFAVNGVLTATIALPPAKYGSPAKQAEFFRSLLAEARTIPGVREVAAVRFLPMNGVASLWDVSVPDRPAEQLPAAFHHIATPDYFNVMRIPLLMGRAFDGDDSRGRTRVVILGQTAARRFFPNAPNPVGRYLRIEDEQRADWQVIGVVGDVRNIRPDRPPRPQIYVPMEQSPAGRMTLVIRSNEDRSGLAGPLRGAVRRIDKDQAIADVKSLAEVVGDASARWRVSTWLFSCFGAAALIQALMGLYSPVSYNVAQRTREIALRVALGSSYGRIVRMILESVARICGAGVMLGLLLAWAANRSLRSLLYGTDPLDARTFAAAAGGFLILALVVSTVAGSRATRIQPADALKEE
jgi:predicted permease